jgi:transposase
MAQHLAIDVHDRTLFVVAVDADTGEELCRRRFPHTPAGIAEIRGRLAPGDTVVMEATRGAHSLANRLESSGAEILLADPQRCRLLGFRGKKTDYRDCLALLAHLRSGQLTTVWRPDARTRERRQVSRERHGANHTVTQCKNRLLALLREEGLESPGELLWGPEGAAWLATLPVAASTLAILRRTWDLLQAVLAVKAQQDQGFAQSALMDPRAWRLLQLPGLGPMAAEIVLGEVGDFTRFAESRQLVSYAGLDPRVQQSGDLRRGGRISKSGRSQLRWIMVEVAWSHVLAHGPEAGLYHRLVRRGKEPGVAITALARHLLVIAHKLLTRDEPYRGENAGTYLRKLAALAAFRPEEQRRPRGRKEGQSDIDWARERYREVTGQEPPRRSPATAAAPAPEAVTGERATPEPAPVAGLAAPAAPAESKAISSCAAGADGVRATRRVPPARTSRSASGARRSPGAATNFANTA